MKIDERCSNCPAIHLRTRDQLVKINKWINLFNEQLSLINDMQYILLGESFPPNRYIYDLTTNYSSGLRHNLRKELAIESDSRLIEYLQKNGILIYDCAFCPLCNLSRPSQKRHAATYCLKAYKIDFLNSNKAKIITFFPKNSGFLKRELPILQSRVIKEFNFSNLTGLNEIINKNNR